MAAIENEHVYGLHLRESATDGSDFTNADADYRRQFLGEDGVLHQKDSAGAVTEPGTGVWTSFTPTIVASGGGFVLGDGSLAGRYKFLGNKAYAIEIHYSRGAGTTNGTGTYTFALPAGLTAGALAQALAGLVLDNGTRWYVAGGYVAAGATTIQVRVADSGTLLGATTPFTFATGDSVILSGVIEVA